MSFRQHLADLESQRLIALFEESQRNAEEQGLGNPVHSLVVDLEDSYPGMVDFVRHIVIEMTDDLEGWTDEKRDTFGTGIMVGGLLLTHALRLEAEIDEIGGVFESPPEG